MKGSLIKVIEELPKLTRKELATARAAIDHLLAGSEKEDSKQAALFSAISAHLGVNIPFQKFQQSAAHKEWIKHAASVVEFVAEFKPKQKVEELAIIRLLMDILTDDLKVRKIPVSIGSVMLNLGRVPEVFDNAFPGYKASGLASLIIKSMRGST